MKTAIVAGLVGLAVASVVALTAVAVESSDEPLPAPIGHSGSADEPTPLEELLGSGDPTVIAERQAAEQARQSAYDELLDECLAAGGDEMSCQEPAFREADPAYVEASSRFDVLETEMYEKYARDPRIRRLASDWQACMSEYGRTAVHNELPLTEATTDLGEPALENDRTVSEFLAELALIAEESAGAEADAAAALHDELDAAQLRCFEPGAAMARSVLADYEAELVANHTDELEQYRRALAGSAR